MGVQPTQHTRKHTRARAPATDVHEFTQLDARTMPACRWGGHVVGRKTFPTPPQSLRMPPRPRFGVPFWSSLCASSLAQQWPAVRVVWRKTSRSLHTRLSGCLWPGPPCVCPYVRPSVCRVRPGRNRRVLHPRCHSDHLEIRFLCGAVARDPGRKGAGGAVVPTRQDRVFVFQVRQFIKDRQMHKVLTLYDHLDSVVRRRLVCVRVCGWAVSLARALRGLVWALRAARVCLACTLRASCLHVRACIVCAEACACACAGWRVLRCALPRPAHRACSPRMGVSVDASAGNGGFTRQIPGRARERGGPPPAELALADCAGRANGVRTPFLRGACCALCA